MQLTFNEILEMEDLNSFNAEDVNSILGEIFESSRDHNDIESLRKGLDFSQKQSLDHFSDYQKMVFHYFTANGWSYLHMLTVVLNSNEFWQMEREEVEKEIIHLRKALVFSSKVKDDFMKCQIFTNLGNALSHVGRIIEAICYWRQAISINTEFGMAIGNLGMGLMHYAKAVYDDAHRFIITKEAYRLLLRAKEDSTLYSEAKGSFESTVNYLEHLFGKEPLLKDNAFKEYSLGKTRKEVEYRTWCLNNCLFLNPLNDISVDTIVSHDSLFLPTITTSIDEPPFFHAFYNQLKQEYVSARYHLYTGIVVKQSHFSDKGNLQIDTFDYSIYSFNLENTKNAFRLSYSLFDKIGYLLNYYLKIGMPFDKVTFRKVWYEEKKGKVVHPVVANSQNWMIRGLYWLSKDLHEKDTDFSEAILPEAKEVATIRNFIEHKSLKVVEYGETKLVENGLTYQLDRDEFETKTYQLLKAVRAALIYLSLAIHINESKKSQTRTTVPFYMQQIPEEFKI